MTPADIVPIVASFIGAALGTFVVYRQGKTDAWGRRFQAAIDLLASADPRQRALGLARLGAITLHPDAGRRGRQEALAVLRADVRAALTDPVLHALAEHGAESQVIVEERGTRVQDGRVFVDRSVVESAVAYTEIAGGADAAPDQIVALVAGAVPPEAVVPPPTAAAGRESEIATNARATLPTDRKLLLVKLTPETTTLTPDALRERARKAWRLSLSRLEAEPPSAVVAIAQQRVIGAWEYKGAQPSDEPNRVEFVLGAEVPDLVGREYRDSSQNPVRYWP